MRNLVLLMVVLGGGILLNGCTFGVVQLGPGGVGPGGIYADVNYPNKIEENMNYKINFQPSDIQIMGPVEATGFSTTILWFVSYGDSGYASLMQEAKNKGADGLMNITVDTKYENILFVYQKATTQLRGVAYKWKNVQQP